MFSTRNMHLVEDLLIFLLEKSWWWVWISGFQRYKHQSKKNPSQHVCSFILYSCFKWLLIFQENLVKKLDFNLLIRVIKLHVEIFIYSSILFERYNIKDKVILIISKIRSTVLLCSIQPIVINHVKWTFNEFLSVFFLDLTLPNMLY